MSEKHEERLKEFEDYFEHEPILRVNRSHRVGLFHPEKKKSPKKKKKLKKKHTHFMQFLSKKKTVNLKRLKPKVLCRFYEKH